MALWLLYIPTPLPVYGLWVLYRGQNRPRWAAALGWLALWILPAIAYQSVWWISDASPYSTDWLSLLQAAPVGLWVLLGGRTVVEVFEATAQDLTGHRHATMFDNVHVYLALTVLQCALFIAILVRRDRPRRRDPVALAIGLAFLANSILGAQWPWWGS